MNLTVHTCTKACKKRVKKSIVIKAYPTVQKAYRTVQEVYRKVRKAYRIYSVQ
jgi:hypothetical protein